MECIAIVLLAGCVTDAPELGPELPADWKSGAELHPYQVFGDHGGGRGADLNPTTDLARPDMCVAYRDNVSHERDSCEVNDPKHSWEDDWPWVIDASWAACPGRDFYGCPDNSYPGPYESRVVAFDVSGRPVAWWDGELAEDTQIVTE